MEYCGYVDVIIPSYNREKTIGRAIESVLNQTYPYVTVVVVDDGSSDNTEQIVKGYSDPRVKFYRHPKNRGACAARNTGIDNSSGEFIAFLDSDDAWFPEKIEKQLTFLLQNNGEITFCSYLRVEKDKTVLYPAHHYSGDLHSQLLLGNFLSNGVILARRECFDQRFDEALPRMQDWDIMLRLSKNHTILHQHEPLAYYYVQEDSITMNHNKLKTALSMLYDKYYDEFSANKEAYAAICRQRAIAEIMTGGIEAVHWLAEANRSCFRINTFGLQLLCGMGLSGTLRRMKQRRLNKRL